MLKRGGSIGFILSVLWVVLQCPAASENNLSIGAGNHSITYGAGIEDHESSFPGKKGTWHGYDRYDFSINGRNCYVVTPRTAASHKPWVWRARFPDYHPEADMILLSKGFYVAYIDVADLYGGPESIKHFDAFYGYLTGTCGLAKRVALEGVSRGGLIVYNWASKNPEKVACIYCDTPVCDFKSWPAGMGNGKGSPADWQKLLKVYGLTEEQALEYKNNPIDTLGLPAEWAVPIMHIVSENDQIVPPKENTYILKERYEKLGGKIIITSIPEGTAESGGHHFPFENPSVPAEFIMIHTAPVKDYFVLRDGLDNCRIRFQKSKAGRVAFLGGSITYNPGWRDKTAGYLQKQFPDTKFEFINAGIPSMGSTCGAFRLNRDVFGRGQVDLLFVEAAVNDQTNGRTGTEQIRGMEGVVRHARMLNPYIDIVMLHFVDPDKVNVINKGQSPEVIVNHEKVAQYYGVPSLNLALEVTERINAGQFNWKDDFRDLHPSLFGQNIYFRSIRGLFDAAWKERIQEDTQQTIHTLPDKPIDAFSYTNGKLADIRQGRLVNGFKYDPSWKPRDGKATRAGFVDVPMLTAESPGAELKFKFEGSAAGILVAAGPDAGIAEYRIDGGPYKRLDLFTAWSRGLHLPWAYILQAELDNVPHELTLKTTGDRNPQSTGSAVRIVNFLVN